MEKKMKLLFFLCFVFLILRLSSCEKSNKEVSHVPDEHAPVSQNEPSGNRKAVIIEEAEQPAFSENVLREKKENVRNTISDIQAMIDEELEKGNGY